MNNRNRSMFIIGIGTTAIVIAIARYLETVQEERQKRAKIQAETKLQIEAINVAKEIVQKRISNGVYDRKLTIADIVNDLRFETIVARFKE